MNVRIAVILSIMIQTPRGVKGWFFLPLAAAFWLCACGGGFFDLFACVVLVSVCLRCWPFLELAFWPFLDLLLVY
jgi:hypothetical protein